MNVLTVCMNVPAITHTTLNYRKRMQVDMCVKAGLLTVLLHQRWGWEVLGIMLLPALLKIAGCQIKGLKVLYQGFLREDIT